MVAGSTRRDEGFLCARLTGRGAADQQQEAHEGEGGAPSGSARAGGPDLFSAGVVPQAAAAESAAESKILQLLNWSVLSFKLV